MRFIVLGQFFLCRDCSINNTSEPRRAKLKEALQHLTWNTKVTFCGVHVFSRKLRYYCDSSAALGLISLNQWILFRFLILLLFEFQNYWYLGLEWIDENKKQLFGIGNCRERGPLGSFPGKCGDHLRACTHIQSALVKQLLNVTQSSINQEEGILIIPWAIMLKCIKWSLYPSHNFIY